VIPEIARGVGTGTGLSAWELFVQEDVVTLGEGAAIIPCAEGLAAVKAGFGLGIPIA
jgi:hypothetical protein